MNDYSLVDVNTVSLWERGGISSETGLNSNNAQTRMRTKTYLSSDIVSIDIDPDYQYIIYVYNKDDDYTFLGEYNGSVITKEVKWLTTRINLKDIGDYYFRILGSRLDNTSVTADIHKSAIKLYSIKQFDLDSTVLEEGVAPDAKAVRQLFELHDRYRYSVWKEYIRYTNGENIFNKFTLSDYYTIAEGSDSATYENDYYRLTYSTNGTFTITAKVPSKDAIDSNAYINIISGGPGNIDNQPLKKGHVYAFYTSSPQIVLEGFQYDSDLDTITAFSRNSLNLAFNNAVLFYRVYDNAYRMILRVFIKDPYIQAGESITFTISCYDITKDIYKLKSTNDTTDRSAEVQYLLNNFGVCEFDEGDFYLSNINMPANSSIYGKNGATKLYLSQSGTMINMNTYCTVRDIDLHSSTSSLTLSDPFEESSPSSIISIPNVEIAEGAGFKHIKLENPIPAGTYVLNVNVNTTNNDYESPPHIFFSNSTTEGTVITGATIVLTQSLPNRNGVNSITITIPETIYKIRFANSNTVNTTTYSTTFTNITLSAQIINTGITWITPTNQFGIIDNCHISGFDYGILAMDTSTPIDHNLAISNCFISNNNIGIYLKRNTEFNKIINCTITRNWYGIINRGGNNDLSNSGIDGNKVGILIDQDEGSNGGHGTISNSSINHSNSNTGYGLIIKDTGRMLVSNCNFYYSKIKLESTDGNIINSCGFGRSAAVEIINGNCSIISNCMIRSLEDTPITLTNNTAAKIIDCYTRGGTAVSASQASS